MREEFGFNVIFNEMECSLFHLHIFARFSNVVVRSYKANDEFSLNINPGQERKIIKADKS